MYIIYDNMYTVYIYIYLHEGVVASNVLYFGQLAASVQLASWGFKMVSMFWEFSFDSYPPEN